MAKAPSRQAFRKLVMRTIAGTAQAPFPGFIEPMHPTQHAKLPAGGKWQYEIKLDGWRGQLHLRNGAAKIFSRNGNDLTAQCATITAAAADLQATSAVLDGEIVVPGRNGIPNFLELRSAMTRGHVDLRIAFEPYAWLKPEGDSAIVVTVLSPYQIPPSTRAPAATPTPAGAFIFWRETIN